MVGLEPTTYGLTGLRKLQFKTLSSLDSYVALPAELHSHLKDDFISSLFFVPLL